MDAPITITLKSANVLTPAEIADGYALIARSGISVPAGVLESVHLVHNPTVLLAHQNDQLVGFQAYSLYQPQTPLRRKRIVLIYGGIAIQDPKTARRGIAQRMAFHYMRYALGPFWSLRSYAIIVGTHNPRLIQLLSLQHRLYLPTDNTIPPSILHFVREFVRQKRNNHFPINDQLVLSPSVGRKSDITEQWSLLYEASQEKFNQLVHDLGIIEESAGRRYLTGKGLLVLCQSSRLQLLKAIGKIGKRWVRSQFSSTAQKPPLVVSEPA